MRRLLADQALVVVRVVVLLAPAAVGVVRGLLRKHLVVVRTLAHGPRLAGTVLASLAVTAACTTGADSSNPEPSRSSSAPPTSTTAAPPSAPATQTPLVVALHPTRPRLDLTVAEVEALRDGAVSTWSALGAGAGALRTGTPAEVRADRDVVAVVPAGEVAPPLTVATVEGVDPLRNPSAYAVTTEGPAPAAVTTVTVTGDVMLGRGWATGWPQVGDPTAALRPMAAPAGAAPT